MIAPVRAQSLTPNFTTGSMTQTVTTTQSINEVMSTERYGGEVQVWNGDNIESVDPASAGANAITSGDFAFEIVDETQPWQLEIITRDAGLIELIDTTRTIEIESTTNTLSVFSQ